MMLNCYGIWIQYINSNGTHIIHYLGNALCGLLLRLNCTFKNNDYSTLIPFIDTAMIINTLTVNNNENSDTQIKKKLQ